MRFLKVFCTLMCFLFISCNTVSVSKSALKRLDGNPVIGTFGIYKNDIISHKFQQIGVPKFKGKIRLTVSDVKIREKNSSLVKSENQLSVSDSFLKPEGYFRLGFADRVGFVDAINAENNGNLKNYLLDAEKNLVVSGMLIKFPEEIARHLDSAIAVYLVNDGIGFYSMEVVTNNKEIKTIGFSQGIAVGYYLSGICWKKDKRGAVIVATISENGSGCPGETKKDPDKIRKTDIFKKIGKR